MHGFDLNDFKNGKAFIHFDGVMNGKADYGPRICIDTNGNKLFELPGRDMIVNEFEDEDVAFVMGANGLYALMNNKGEFLTDFVYNTICGGSEEGFFEATRNGKHGHIDITGKEVVPCMYDDGRYFSEGVAPECLNGKWGMVDAHNNTIIPFEYEGICVCKNNLINAQRGKYNGCKYGFINKNNEVIVDFLYDEIDCWCTRECKVYPAQKEGKWGLIDRDGNVVEDFIYEDAQLISENSDNAGEFIILLKEEYKAIYSTKKKGFITDFEYTYIGYLSDNRFLVQQDASTGFVDLNGEVVIPLIYEKCTFEDFTEGLCAVYKSGKAGMIETMGCEIIPFEYYKLNSCHEGMIVAVNEKHETAILNRSGKIIVPFGKYHTHSNYSDGFIHVWTKDGRQTYLNKQGEELEIKL